jgi:hypothetical protein
MYHRLVAQCAQTLANIEIWLDKAEEHAKSKGFNVNVLMSSRLAPDMGALMYQIQSASDYVKATAAFLTGQKPPKFDDTETTIDEARTRIQRTIAFVESVVAAKYVGAGERIFPFSWSPGRNITGHDYLVQVAIPNVYFHACMAYAILRHNGVNVGKMDYAGPISLAAG